MSDIDIHIPAEQVYLQDEKDRGFWSRAYAPFSEGRSVCLSLNEEEARALISKINEALNKLIPDYW